MVPLRRSGTVTMPLLTEDPLNDTVNLIEDDYGSWLTDGDVSENTGLILKKIPGFETVDFDTLTRVINEIRNNYDASVRKTQETPNPRN